MSARKTSSPDGAAVATRLDRIVVANEGRNRFGGDGPLFCLDPSSVSPARAVTSIHTATNAESAPPTIWLAKSDGLKRIVKP